MVNAGTLKDIAASAALALCVEELDKQVPSWRDALSEKAEFAAHDRAVRTGQFELISDTDSMEQMAKMVRRMLVRTVRDGPPSLKNG